MSRPLGRREPSDWLHVEKYPLSEAPTAPKGVPVVLGIPWYSNFDSPKKVNGIWVIGQGDLGRVRGGHCIVSKPPKAADLRAWYKFYDQGNEGACVGFGCSRAMSLLNRKRYDAWWLYHRAQATDEYPDTPPEEGTSVRAGLEILRTEGHVVRRKGVKYPPSFAEGISAYRWATTWDEVRSTLGIPDSVPFVPLLNSWGTYYPHIVHLTDEAGERVLSESGEAGIITDR